MSPRRKPPLDEPGQELEDALDSARTPATGPKPRRPRPKLAEPAAPKPVREQPLAVAADVGKLSMHDRDLTFKVSPAMVRHGREWSRPVRYKFVEEDDGSATMWLQWVDLTTPPE